MDFPSKSCVRWGAINFVTSPLHSSRIQQRASLQTSKNNTYLRTIDAAMRSHDRMVYRVVSATAAISEPRGTSSDVQNIYPTFSSLFRCVNFGAFSQTPSSRSFHLSLVILSPAGGRPSLRIFPPFSTRQRSLDPSERPPGPPLCLGNVCNGRCSPPASFSAMALPRHL